MGDGGDGAEGMEALAEMPVDFGTETVLEIAGDPGEDADLRAITGGGGDPGTTGRERNEDELIDLTWIEPDTTSGT